MSKTRSDNLSIIGLFRESTFSGKIAFVLSTWFGSGLVPYASGTSGTLAAVPLILLLDSLGIRNNVFTALTVVAVAVWSSERIRVLLRKKDPSQVVIDEVAGFFLAMAFLPLTWPALCLCFVLFRIFDILKPFPVKQMEALRGGFGIVMDDLLAGLYAYAGTWLILFVVKSWQ